MNEKWLAQKINCWKASNVKAKPKTLGQMDESDSKSLAKLRVLLQDDLMLIPSRAVSNFFRIYSKENINCIY